MNVLHESELCTGHKEGVNDKNKNENNSNIQSTNNQFYNIYYSNLDTITNKKCERNDLINKENPDIICFIELLNKLDPNMEKAEVTLKGYDLFLGKSPQRGVLIYTNQNIKAQEFTVFDDLNFKESVWCTFETKNTEKVLVGNIYHSPNSDEENTNLLLTILRDDKNIFKLFDRILITGDFNYPGIKWSNDILTNKDEFFFNAVQDGYLIQHVKNPTRHRINQQSNILDLVFSQDEEDIQNIEHCSPIGKSDHELLKIKTNILKPKLSDNNSTKLNLDKGDYGSFKKYISNTKWSEVLYDLKTEDCSNFIRDKIEEGIKTFIPKTNFSNKKGKKSNFKGELKKSVKKKYKLYKRWLESDNSWVYQNYVKERNLTSKLLKKAKKEHEQKIASKSKENPKVFWNFINQKRKCKENIPALKGRDGVTYTDDYNKTCILNEFFSSVFTVEDKNNIPYMAPGEKSNNIFISDIMNITEETVSLKLKSLNPNKSPGPDKMYPRVLKELHQELSIPLTHLFKLSLKEGELPSDWKHAEVTAIFKKGIKTDPGNYRPVSLTSVICKVLESFIRDTIQIHMEHNKLYSTCQHGFRKKRSCTSQLLEVMEDFTGFLEGKQNFDVIYLDFRKAFDSVPHERLLLKLEAYGITGGILKWIRSFLEGRTQKVRIGNESSSTSRVTSGIPQGSILGPILFTIFINDLPEAINSICKIFADDTKIYNTCKNHVTIQQDLTSLQIWSNKWQLYFNGQKCKCLHHGRANPNHTYHFENENGNEALPDGFEETDLGVTFTLNLNFDKHINDKVKKANMMLGLIKRNFSFIDKNVFNTLYKSLIRPHLEYAQEVWQPYLKRQSKLIESVQRRATKLIPEIKHLTYEKRLSYLELPTLKYRRLRGDMILTYNIFESGDQEIIKKLLHPRTCMESAQTRGNGRKLMKEHCRLNVRRYTYSQRIVNIWNSLPRNIVYAENTNRFKGLFDVHMYHLMLEHDGD